MAPKIAIIGAGPGGLTLASILQKNGIACSIYEADLSSSSRDQGGIVDLHEGTGQLAMREAGLIEQFQASCIEGAEAMKLVKSDGSVPWNENTMTNIPQRNRPEIDRKTLRKILLDSLNPGSIHWNKKLVNIVPNGAQYNLHFVDGTEPDFDLVVGADGAWSKVRPLLSDEFPFYSGVTIIELRAAEVSTKKQWLNKFTGKGNCFMFDEGRALVCQQNGNDNIRVYAGVRQAEDWFNGCGIDWTQDDARKRLAEEYFADCHDDIKRVIEEATDDLIPRPLYMLPVGFKWQAKAGLTLLGDAAHLMTPFAGVGVNVALTDAMTLAKALLKQPNLDNSNALVKALHEYESAMFVYAKENMEKTWNGLEGHFSADGIDRRVALMNRKLKQLLERVEAPQRQVKKEHR